MSDMKLKELRKLAEVSYRYFVLKGSDVTELNTDLFFKNKVSKDDSVFAIGEGNKWFYYDWGSQIWHSVATPPKALLAYGGTSASNGTPTKHVAPTPKTPITSPKGTELADDEYYYKINGPYSFSWATIDAAGKIDNNIKEFTSDSKTWEDAVKVINDTQKLQPRKPRKVSNMSNTKLKELRKLAADLPGNLYGSPISNQTNPTVPKNSITKKSAIDDESVAALAAQQGPTRSIDEFKDDYADLSGKRYFDLQRLYNQYIAAKKTTAPAKPATPKSTAVIDQNLWGETLSDQPGSTTGYTYTIGGDGKSLTYKETGSTSQMKPLNQSYSQWDKVVIAINALGKKLGIGQLQADNAKTDPAATPQDATTKPAEAAPVMSNAMSNVALILSNVKAGATYAGKTVFRNEKAMVRKMLDAIDSVIAKASKEPALKAIGSATNALALLIVRSDPSLETRPIGTVSATELSALNEKMLSSKYQGDLDVIMSIIRDLHDKKQFVKRVGEYIKVVIGTVNSTQTATQPAAKQPITPQQAPVANQQEMIEKASAKLAPKIIRLASLRRLRVRSEMEAAITGSAMPGRDRVI